MCRQQFLEQAKENVLKQSNVVKEGLESIALSHVEVSRLFPKSFKNHFEKKSEEFCVSVEALFCLIFFEAYAACFNESSLVGVCSYKGPPKDSQRNFFLLPFALYCLPDCKKTFCERVKDLEKDFRTMLSSNFSVKSSLDRLGKLPFLFTTREEQTLQEDAALIFHHLFLGQQGEHYLLKWRAPKGIIDEDKIRDILEAFKIAATELFNTPSKKLYYLDIRSEYDIEVQNKVNQTHHDFQEELLQDAFHRCAQNKPHAPALYSSDFTLTYQTLSSLSNQLAHFLIQKGAKPNHLVAILAEKGWRQVLACLGVLGSGSAYLPIEPDWPQERIEQVLNLSKPSHFLIEEQFASMLRGVDYVEVLGKHALIYLDGKKSQQWKEMPNYPPRIKRSGKDLAYVMFTSGSTGTPKGVMITHEGVVNTLKAVMRKIKLSSEDCLLSLSNYCFDLSVFDLFASLSSGASVVILNHQQSKDPYYWDRLMKKYQVSVWSTVPMLMNMLCDYFMQRRTNPEGFSLRVVLLSGDMVPPLLPLRILELFSSASHKPKIYELGGSTEASIWSTISCVESAIRRAQLGSVPYGKPLSNQEVYVLDQRQMPVPMGKVGNLYIGGVGLARGYWNDPEKTQESFIFSRFLGKRIYKTGDVARFLPDGQLEFLGRKDKQIKIRGHRVDLGEIESMLDQIQGVKQSVLLLHTLENGTKELMAFVVKNMPKKI